MQLTECKEIRFILSNLSISLIFINNYFIKKSFHNHEGRLYPYSYEVQHFHVIYNASSRFWRHIFLYNWYTRNILSLTVTTELNIHTSISYITHFQFQDTDYFAFAIAVGISGTDSSCHRIRKRVQPVSNSLNS